MEKILPLNNDLTGTLTMFITKRQRKPTNAATEELWYHHLLLNILKDRVKTHSVQVFHIMIVCVIFGFMFRPEVTLYG